MARKFIPIKWPRECRYSRSNICICPRSRTFKCNGKRRNCKLFKGVNDEFWVDDKINK